MNRKAILFLSDILLLYASLTLMLKVRYPVDFNSQYGLHVLPFTIIFILWLLVFYIANLYDVRSLRNNAEFYSDFFRAITIAAGISVLFFYFIPFFLIKPKVIAPKTNLFIFISFFLVLDIFVRYLINRFSEKKFKKTTLIIGLNPQSLELASFMNKNPQFGYELKYLVDIESGINPSSGESEQFKILRGVENLGQVIRDSDIDTVVLSPEAYQTPDLINILYRSLERKINFYNLAFFYENLTGQVPLGAINQIWFLENLNEGNKKTYESVKKFWDLIFGVIFGLISLALYPFIILAIKLSSRGPIFYKQIRLGQAGKLFEIIKFRTMGEDAEKDTGAVWASDNDPRITRVGRFLRKTRLDEMPQIWNVLKGEMSLVGPRAERPEFNDRLKSIPFYEERYLVKPGLSGWAQINYPYGASVKDTQEKLKYDLYYVKNRSLLIDLGIILKTIRIVLMKAGK